MGLPKTTVDHWMRPESSLRVYRPSLEREAECAAYREALKNVMRSKPGERVRVAREALFGKNVSQRGKTMLKVVKAAVIAGHYLRAGTDKEFTKAIAALEVALERFELRGASVRKWLKEKLR